MPECREVFLAALLLIPFAVGVLRPRWWVLLVPLAVIATAVAWEAATGRLRNHYEDTPLTTVAFYLLTWPVGMGAGGAGIAVRRRFAHRFARLS
jgi:hypothetical protein